MLKGDPPLITTEGDETAGGRRFQPDTGRQPQSRRSVRMRPVAVEENNRATPSGRDGGRSHLHTAHPLRLGLGLRGRHQCARDNDSDTAASQIIAVSKIPFSPFRLARPPGIFSSLLNYQCVCLPLLGQNGLFLKAGFLRRGGNLLHFAGATPPLA